MNDLKELLNEISDLTNTIETQYPELYQFLEEDPMTLPVARHPKVDKSTLEKYLQSLRELLKHHLETHNNRG
ncbi:hypothetical protein [Flagellimonas lutaonensis]|uniref:Uncharacterized protein n=1 Tax=Flagellimonas lutaonensis TaxID=516051 RepID=A0A0D5YQS3_9FLAO|nr:hypothetical protein [Allomuricauda lutaonensis]AKA34274.1 hypothetical protein VC82_602 [Allomuricauda lutaonensis]